MKDVEKKKTKERERKTRQLYDDYRESAKKSNYDERRIDGDCAFLKNDYVGGGGKSNGSGSWRLCFFSTVGEVTAAATVMATRRRGNRVNNETPAGQRQRRRR